MDPRETIRLHSEPAGTERPRAEPPAGAWRASLAAAAYLVGAVSLVNPALARECGSAAEVIRAAIDGRLPAGLGDIDAAVERAVRQLDAGDGRGCLSELALIGQAPRA